MKLLVRTKRAYFTWILLLIALGILGYLLYTLLVPAKGVKLEGDNQSTVFHEAKVGDKTRYKLACYRVTVDSKYKSIKAPGDPCGLTGRLSDASSAFLIKSVSLQMGDPEAQMQSVFNRYQGQGQFSDLTLQKLDANTYVVMGTKVHPTSDLPDAKYAKVYYLYGSHTKAGSYDKSDNTLLILNGLSTDPSVNIADELYTTIEPSR